MKMTFPTPNKNSPNISTQDIDGSDIINDSNKLSKKLRNIGKYPKFWEGEDEEYTNAETESGEDQEVEEFRIRLMNHTMVFFFFFFCFQIFLHLKKCFSFSFRQKNVWSLIKNLMKR